MNGGLERDLIDSFGEFASAWEFPSPPAVLLLILAFAYLVGSLRLSMRARSDRSFWAHFAAGVTSFVLLAIALAGPLDVYASDLFTAHTSQHIGQPGN